MTPDAAAVIAQIFATILVALVVEARFRPRPSEGEPQPRDPAWGYALGLAGVLVGLLTTLMGVIAGRSLGLLPTMLVVVCLLLDVIPMVTLAFDHVMPRLTVARGTVVLSVLLGAGILLLLLAATAEAAGGLFGP